MACSNVKQIPVFARTNLGTRIVIAVSPETTVEDFKREFERAHLNCFQELGKIRVYALKVKKKSCFYNIPESFSLKHVFGSLRNDLLHIEVYRMQNQSGPAESHGAEICKHISDFRDVPNTPEMQNFVATTAKNRNRYRRKNRRTKRMLCFKSLIWKFNGIVHFLNRKNKCSNRRRNIAAKNGAHGFQQRPHFPETTVNHFASKADNNWVKELENNPKMESHGEIFSETVSVSGIIERYFSNYEEVTSSSRFSFLAVPTVNKHCSMREIASNYQKREFDMSLPLMASTPPQRLQLQSVDQHRPKSSGSTHEKNIGGRIVAASDNLGVLVNKKTPTLSLHKFRERNPLVPNSSTKKLVFDITDEDG